MASDFWLMYADEADQDGSKQFLVSAGVFVPSAAAIKLHEEIISLRQKFGFEPGDDLKFSVTTKPMKVTPHDHTAIKQDIMALAEQLECRVCLYLTPHDIAKGQTPENRLKYSTNTLLSQFNWFLKTRGKGAALFDRSTDFNQFNYFKEIFQNGLPFQSNRRPTENIVSISPISNNSSHLSSLSDIVTGSFRWVVNEPQRDKVGSALWNTLGRLMWYEENAERKKIYRDRGFCLRPKGQKVLSYQADVGDLIARLKRYSAG